MNNQKSVLIGLLAMLALAFAPATNKLVSKDAHISFFSHTAVEDITANNYKTVSTIDLATGDVVFSVPLQSFEFEKALMQKHFNSADFLDTKQFPKSKFVGKITNLPSINFSKDGTYPATARGELTLKDVTKTINETGTIKVEGTKLTLDIKMKIVLADYKISFSKGKPSTNIAKEIEATITAIYLPE